MRHIRIKAPQRARIRRASDLESVELHVVGYETKLAYNAEGVPVYVACDGKPAYRVDFPDQGAQAKGRCTEEGLVVKAHHFVALVNDNLLAPSTAASHNHVLVDYLLHTVCIPLRAEDGEHMDFLGRGDFHSRQQCKPLLRRHLHGHCNVFDRIVI